MEPRDTKPNPGLTLENVEGANISGCTFINSGIHLGPNVDGTIENTVVTSSHDSQFTNTSNSYSTCAAFSLPAITAATVIIGDLKVELGVNATRVEFDKTSVNSD